MSCLPRATALPIADRAVAALRTLPGDSPGDVRKVGDDALVRVAGTGRPPFPGADFGSPAFKTSKKPSHSLFPGAIPVPFLMIADPATRPDEDLTRNINQLNPIVATPGLVSGTHGTDERVRADDLVRAARFFAQLIRNAL